MADLEYSSGFIFASNYEPISIPKESSTLNEQETQFFRHRRTQSNSMHDFKAFFGTKQEKSVYPSVPLQTTREEIHSSSPLDLRKQLIKSKPDLPSVDKPINYTIQTHVKSSTPEVRPSQHLFPFRNRKARSFIKVLDAAIDYFNKESKDGQVNFIHKEVQDAREDLNTLHSRLNDTDNIYIHLLQDYSFITSQIEDFESHDLNYKLHIHSLKSGIQSLSLSLKSSQNKLKLLRAENELLLTNSKSKTPTPSSKFGSVSKMRLSSLQVSSAEASEDDLASIVSKIKRTEVEIRTLQRKFSEMMRDRDKPVCQTVYVRTGSRKFSVE